MNLHELCDAYRNGKKWYIYTGSQEAVSTCRTGLFAEVDIPVTDNVENGNHWELYREISFRVMGSDPFHLSDFVDDANDDLHNVSAEDLITIGKCISKAWQMYLLWAHQNS